MKRIFFTLLICTLALTCNAQGIYRTVKKYDKFDDVVWKREVKTLITKTDTSFIVETKGQEPVEYSIIDNPLYIESVGSKDSLVNIVQDVWGYEKQYIVFAPKDKEDYLNYISEKTKDMPDSTTLDIAGYKMKVDTYNTYSGLYMLNHYKELPTISIRTVSRYKYSFEYYTDLFWIKFNDGTRIIYER